MNCTWSCGKLPLAVVTMFATSSAYAADAWCEGRDPVPVTGQHYSFTYESWVRTRNGGRFFGRCIKVAPPTQKLKNEWTSVLPSSVARTDSPTKGGRSFPDLVEAVDHTTELFYGNSHDKVDATFMAHPSESTPAQEKRDPSIRDRIEAILEEFGILQLDNEYSFSVEDKNDNEFKIDFNFLSAFDGNSFVYKVGFELTPIAVVDQEQKLYLVIDGDSLNQLAEIDKDKAIKLTDFGGFTMDFSSKTASPKSVDFVSYQMSIRNRSGENIATIPVSYVLPGADN